MNAAFYHLVGWRDRPLASKPNHQPIPGAANRVAMPGRLQWSGDTGGDPRTCVLHFASQSQCIGFMNWINRLRADPSL